MEIIISKQRTHVWVSTVFWCVSPEDTSSRRSSDRDIETRLWMVMYYECARWKAHEVITFFDDSAIPFLYVENHLYWVEHVVDISESLLQYFLVCWMLLLLMDIFVVISHPPVRVSKATEYFTPQTTMEGDKGFFPENSGLRWRSLTFDHTS